jgi:hypothetical protein
LKSLDLKSCRRLEECRNLEECRSLEECRNLEECRSLEECRNLEELPESCGFADVTVEEPGFSPAVRAYNLGL